MVRHRIGLETMSLDICKCFADSPIWWPADLLR